MMRSPMLRTQPLAGLVSTPIATSCLTARGVSPSPQTFSRGNAVFSSTRTSRPCRARWYAVALPAGPAPTTMTSASYGAGLAGVLTVVVSPRLGSGYVRL